MTDLARLGDLVHLLRGHFTRQTPGLEPSHVLRQRDFDVIEHSPQRILRFCRGLVAIPQSAGYQKGLAWARLDLPP